MNYLPSRHFSTYQTEPSQEASANVVRIFSAVNLTKTKTRNKLVTPTVNGVLLASQRINKDCVSFEPSFHEYSRMTKTLLYSDEKFNNESTNNCMIESEDIDIIIPNNY